MHLCPPLDRDVVHTIADALPSVSDIATLSLVSTEWAAGVTNDVWRKWVLKHFPLAINVLQSLGVTNPSYRAVYIDQINALAMPPPAFPSVPVNERLQKFVVTIVLHWDGEEPERNSISWVGNLRDARRPPASHGVGCTLWEREHAPQWAVDLDSTGAIGRSLDTDEAMDEYGAAFDNIRDHLRLAITVSKVVGQSVRTISLYDEFLEVKDFSFNSIIFDADRPQQLPIASVEAIRGRDAHADWQGVSPTIHPWIDCATGELESLFRYGGHMREPMSPEHVADYFERFAAW